MVRAASTTIAVAAVRDRQAPGGGSVALGVVLVVALVIVIAELVAVAGPVCSWWPASQLTGVPARPQ